MTLKYSTGVRWLFLILSLLIVSCNNESRVAKQLQNIKLPFKTIILEGWEGNLLDVQKDFPGGKLTRGSIKKRIAALYSLKVTMPDINVSGNLRIHQREEDINQTKQSYLPVRVLYIPCNDSEELKNNYKSIKTFLKQEFSVGNNSNTIKAKDGYFIKFTPDYSDGISIDIEVNESENNKYNSNKKYIEIILQRPQTIKTDK